MFRLLLVLCAGLFLTMLIAGRDHGQARMGLTGAYDIADLKPLPEPVEVAEVAQQAAPVRSVAVAPQSSPAAPTTVAYSPPQDGTATGLQNGLTLSLPLVAAEPAADPEVSPVQTAEPEAAPLIQVGYVIGSTVNVRAEPSAKATVLDKLSRGEAVTVLGEGAPGWSVIRIEGDGIEGYVATRYLAISPADGPIFSTSD